MFLVDFLRFILEFFYNITDSYGVSILLLSLTVTILMLPLFYLAEIIQNKEARRKEKMQPYLDEIKDVKNKQEKFYYTREVYRKHNYSPFYSLSGLLGLLFQIPFFIAAYWMLLKYHPLEGVPFGPIKDLYQPDALIAFGKVSINALPFVMTGINVFASYIHARNKTRTEQVQLILISLVFLVLLYNLSAALVLYWTMNNFYAIGKNWLMSKINFSEIEYPFGFLSKLNMSPYLKKSGYIIYPLIFSLFPLLSMYFTNIGELYFSQIVILSLVILIAMFMLLAVAKVIFRNKEKEALFGFLAVAVFFSFGHVGEFLKRTIVLYYKPVLLLGAYFIIFGVLAFLLWRTKKKLGGLSKVLNVLSVVLIFTMIFRILSYHIFTPTNNNYFGETMDDVIEDEESSVGTAVQYPDIYFLVLDGYANSGILKEVHDFDNSSFENKLKERDFYIAKDGRCNYLSTFLSLASSLNMKYVTYLKDVLGPNSTNKNLPYEMISDNNVNRYLKNKGYKSVHIKSGWGVTKSNTFSDYNLPTTNSIGEFTTTFLQTTILLPVINHFAIKNYTSNITYAFDNMDKLDYITDPKFVFAHIVCPHPPYVFDENGNTISKDIKLDNDWSENEKEFYIQQLKYVNKKTMNLVDNIFEKSKNSIIIIQSDHGTAFLGENWENPSDAFIKERGKIFNAIHLNDDGNESLYTNISSVNTFRVVFNNVFNDDFEILNDSTFFSTYEKPYDFKDVTNILNNQ